MRKAIFAGAALLLSASVVAETEREQWARLSDQNQLSLLQYCRAQGYVSAEIVERQRAALRVKEGAASLAGRAGVILYLGPQATLAEAAAASGITIAYRCQQMGYLIR